MKNKILSTVFACILMCTLLQAQENIIQKFRITLNGGYSIPSKQSKMQIFGGDIKVSNALQTNFGVAYKVFNNWDLSLNVSTSKHSLELTNANLRDLAIYRHEISYGKVWVTPIGLQIRYRPLVLGRFQPYAGVGGGYVFFNHINPGWAIKSISYNNVWRVFAEVGTEIQVFPHWLANVFIKKDYSDRSNMHIDFSNTIPKYNLYGQVKWDMLSTGIGLSYQF